MDKIEARFYSGRQLHPATAFPKHHNSSSTYTSSSPWICTHLGTCCNNARYAEHTEPEDREVHDSVHSLLQGSTQHTENNATLPQAANMSRFEKIDTSLIGPLHGMCSVRFDTAV